MSLYSSIYPYGAQFDDNAPWEPDFVACPEPEREESLPIREPVVCKNCGEPIEYFPSIPVPCLQWRHADGFYGCNKGRPMYSPTSAEPSDPAVTPQTPQNRAWRQRLDDACKEAL